MTSELRTGFLINVRTPWLDFSPALHWHAQTRIDAMLHGFRSRIRLVNVKVSDHDSSSGARRCDIEIVFTASGSLSVLAYDADAYRAVATAARRARTVVRRHVERLKASRWAPADRLVATA